MSSPMMQQFAAAKARCPGALVLFRMGDFYELFGDDAREAAALLDLTLTSRDKGPDALPMAGFPFHQLDTQLARLVAAGRRVAICEQIDDPKTTKGLLRREVTRIVTPGIAADESLLAADRRNHLLALVPAGSGTPAGLAWIDVAAGRFEAATLPGDDVADLVLRLAPSECLCGEGDRAAAAEAARGGGFDRALTTRPDWWFGAAEVMRALDGCLGCRLEGLGFDLPADLPGIRAAGAIVAYLRENDPAAVARINSLSPWRPGHRLEIDEASRRSLELLRSSTTGLRAGSLVDVLDRTRTAMGGRLLGEWITAPLVDRAAIDERLDAVAALVAAPATAAALADAIAEVGDLERLVGRAVAGRAGPRDVERIGRAATALPAIRTALAAASGLLAELRDGLDPCADVAERVGATFRDGCPVSERDGGFIRPGRDPRLDELTELASGGKAWIAAYQAEQIARTGIASLKVGFNRVFGFFLEVGRAHAGKVPADYVRKQTVKNAERYTTPELDQRQRQVLSAEDDALRRELELLAESRAFVAGCRERLDRAAAIAAILDCLGSLAAVARSAGWVRPEIGDDGRLEIVAGRHPVLERLLPAGALVANDLSLWGGPGRDPATAPSLALVTGPNMGGKSTFIRQAAILVVLAQAGSFVPADRARVGIVDRLFARIGAGDDLARGASTFLVEMAQTARILNRATAASLVILDEVGRGTSTFDGLAVAQAVVEDLHDRVGCRTLFATHYLQLAALERLPGVANLQVLVEQHEGGLVFLHRVARGAADRSWGVHVARLAGVPEPVIDRACDLLAAFEGGATDGAATAAAPLDAPPRDSARGKRRSAPDPAAAQRTLFD
ncbi:MAG: DNA mismatch repair protein MutS [Planctomycetes bacterium]|nr:DNA mismatch repair protein MutS [Planctomycetota bacterium]